MAIRVYAVDDQEYHPDVERCVAAPVARQSCVVVPALGYTAPQAHLLKRKSRNFAAQVTRSSLSIY